MRKWSSSSTHSITYADLRMDRFLPEFNDFSGKEVGFDQLMLMLDYADKVREDLEKSSGQQFLFRSLWVFVMVGSCVFVSIAGAVLLPYSLRANDEYIIPLLVAGLLSSLIFPLPIAYLSQTWSSKTLKRLKYEREQLEKLIEGIREARRATLDDTTWTPLMRTYFRYRLSRFDIGESRYLK